MDQKEKDVVKAVLNRIKKESFVADYTATDEEAMGLLISKYFEWGGESILQASGFALEDANFHTENETVQELLAKLQKND